MTSPTALYRRRRHQLIAYGKWEPSLIPAGHVAAHVRDLVAHGRSRRWIARTAGVHDNVVCRLAASKAAYVSRDNAEKLMAVTAADTPAGKTRVPSAGTRRRVEALATLGWGHDDVAAYAGMHRKTITSLAGPRLDWVAADAANAVASAYTRLRTQRRDDETGRRVRTRAQRRDFASPDAWTRFTIDDPHAHPLTTIT